MGIFTGVISKQCEDLLGQGERLIAELQEIGWKENVPGRLEARHEVLLDSLSTLTSEVPEQVKMPPAFVRNYHRWYASCLAIVEQNMPSRVAEIISQHKGSGKASERETITSLLQHEYFSAYDQRVITGRLRQIVAVVGSVPGYIKMRLYDLELAVAQAYVGDQLTEARILLKRRHVRASGAIAGVLLERHLKLICDRHSPPLKYPQKTSTISHLNDMLRDAGVYDVSQWRKVQWMGDIRNQCDHAGADEPRTEDVNDLIESVAKFTALFAG